VRRAATLLVRCATYFTGVPQLFKHYVFLSRHRNVCVSEVKGTEAVDQRTVRQGRGVSKCLVRFFRNCPVCICVILFLNYFKNISLHYLQYTYFNGFFGGDNPQIGQAGDWRDHTLLRTSRRLCTTHRGSSCHAVQGSANGPSQLGTHQLTDHHCQISNHPQENKPPSGTMIHSHQ